MTCIAKRGVRPQWPEGVYLFVIGLAKKVLVADRIADLIDPMLMVPSDLTPGSAWLALVGFSMQIYFDFSGYSNMAIGLGRLFGVELPQNFNNPYQALNPSDFWKRWHMTLSQWLRDYLYIPFGGSRFGSVRTLLNILITMSLGGLWHGASWNFGLWGLYHGGLLVLYHSIRRTWDGLPVVIQRFGTIVAVMLG